MSAHDRYIEKMLPLYIVKSVILCLLFLSNFCSSVAYGGHLRCKHRRTDIATNGTLVASSLLSGLLAQHVCACTFPLQRNQNMLGNLIDSERTFFRLYPIALSLCFLFVWSVAGRRLHFIPLPHRLPPKSRKHSVLVLRRPIVKQETLLARQLHWDTFGTLSVLMIDFHFKPCSTIDSQSVSICSHES